MKICATYLIVMEPLLALPAIVRFDSCVVDKTWKKTWNKKNPVVDWNKTKPVLLMLGENKSHVVSDHFRVSSIGKNTQKN